MHDTKQEDCGTVPLGAMAGFVVDPRVTTAKVAPPPAVQTVSDALFDRLMDLNYEIARLLDLRAELPEWALDLPEYQVPWRDLLKE